MRSIIKMILISGVVAALPSMLPVFQRVILLPLYIESNHQWAASLINRISALLLVPGKSVTYYFAPPHGHYFETGPLIAASLINFVLWFFAIFALLVRDQMRGRSNGPVSAEAEVAKAVEPTPETGRQTTPPAEQRGAISRRDFLRTGLGTGANLAIVSAGVYPVLVRPGWLTVRRVEVEIPGLAAALSGLTIAQFTDLHHDEWISIEHVRSAVDLTNSLKPDVVALTGDYVTSRNALIRPAVAELARLRPRLGTVGVMGNHDWWADPEETRRQFKAFEIPLIDNSRLFISTDGKLSADPPESGLCIGGVGDLWEGVVDAERAFAKVPASMPRILLSHNPDVAENSAVATGHVPVDLMLSGHTHGGQVRLPFIGAPVIPSAYGQKYAQGLIQGPACQVHVSAGIGMAGLPVRLGVPPEIVLLRLRAGSARNHVKFGMDNA